MSGQQPFFRPQRRTASGPSRNDTDSTFHQIEDNGFDSKTFSTRPKGSPWEMYNERASIYDREMLKEWEDTLSILLVFTALFSAILTAFIISSLPIMEEDKQEITRDILLVISRQLHNTSIPAYDPVQFKAPQWAVRVNILFFTSLGCNLFAALSSVLALQWVRDYDIGLSGITDPRERALRRHFRFQGVRAWLMPEIISMLPTLLHISLLLFIGGLLEWLLQINHDVAYTMSATLAVCIAFYIGTQVIAASAPSAPYRTPISRSLGTWLRLVSTTFSLVKSGIGSRILRPYDFGQPTRVELGRHSREVKALKSSYSLPSSALFWLLNHTNHSDRSAYTILDICSSLVHEEGVSTISQARPENLVHWPSIIDNVVQALGQQRNKDFTYPPQVENQFATVFGLLAVFGGKRMPLQPSSWHILTREPFRHVHFQSTPLGLTGRFALWRHGKGYPLDTSGPPVDLFQGICRNYGRILDIIVICVLQETRKLFTANEIHRQSVSACLIPLLNSPDPITGISHIFKNKSLSKEIVMTALLLVQPPIVEDINVNNNVGLHRAIVRLFDAYTASEDPVISSSSELGGLIYAFLPQIVYDLALDQETACTQATLQVFRHPLIASIWSNSSYKTQFNRSAMMIQDVFWGESRTLYPESSEETPRWAVELIHSILLLLNRITGSLTPGKEDWKLVTACLQTLGCCVSGQRYEERWTVESMEDPTSWVVRLLRNLEPGMKDRTFSFLIATLLSGSVRKLFDRNLHCIASKERTDRLQQINYPVLRILGCFLLGWEYAEHIPTYDDPLWDSSSMRITITFKNGFGPYMLYASDAPLLLEISRRENDKFLHDKLIWFLVKYSRLSVFVSQSTVSSRKLSARELLTLAIPAFMNMPRWQCDATSLIHDWSELDGFFQAFLELGGLEWLTTLTYPCANSCRACIYFSNPISGLLSCIGGLKGQSFIHQTVRLLPQAQSELILRSSILRNSVEDENAHEYIFIIKTLYVHLRDMGHQGAFPETASQCAKIMARGSQRERYWERTRLQFNAGSFENWCEEVMALIHDLNKVSISDNLVTGPSTVPLLNQRAF